MATKRRGDENQGEVNNRGTQVLDRRERASERTRCTSAVWKMKKAEKQQKNEVREDMETGDTGQGLNSRQDLFDATERSAFGGDSNPFGNGAPIQWAGPKVRLSPHPS